MSDEDILDAFRGFQINDKQNDAAWCREYITKQLFKRDQNYKLSHSQLCILRQLKLLNYKLKPNAKGRDLICEVYF